MLTPKVPLSHRDKIDFGKAPKVSKQQCYHFQGVVCFPSVLEDPSGAQILEHHVSKK